MLQSEAYNTKVEPNVKEWYDYLAQGKLMGLKCKDCGEIAFPPFPVCNGCSGTDMEWVELSGEGTLITFSQSTSGILPFATSSVIVAWVEMAEGPVFMSWLVDVDQSLEAQEELNHRLPLPVTTEIREMDAEAGIFYPVFHLKEE